MMDLGGREEEAKRKEKRELAALDVEPLPPPGPWMRDEDVDICGICRQEFSFFVRKHHCRVCGGIFCAICSANKMELPVELYHENAGEQRVCHLCFSNYNPFSERMLDFIEKESEKKGFFSGPDYVSHTLATNPDGTLEKRLLIIAEYRICIYRTEEDTFEEGFEGEISEEVYHILDLSGMKCDGSHVISLMLTNPWRLFDTLRDERERKKKVVSIKLILPRAGHLVALLRKIFRRACYGVVPLPVELAEKEFGKEIVPLWDGDYGDVYKAICTYMNTEVTPAILEVMGFLTQLPSTEVDFGLISDPSYPVKSVKAAAASLRFHPHFQKIIFDDRVASFVFDALKVNDVIHTLVGSGLWSSSLLDFAAVIPYNPDNAIQVIHLEDCRFSHEAVLSFSAGLSSLSHGLLSLSLSHCSLRGGDVSALVGGTLIQNWGISGRIKKLDLSGNDLGREGSEVLRVWLDGLGGGAGGGEGGGPGVGELERLVLVGCGLVVGSVLRGVQKVRTLKQLDISKNPIKKSDLSLLTSFCEKIPGLERLGVSGCGLSPEACVDVVTTLMSNQNLQGLHLDLSYNQMDRIHAFDLAGPQDIYGTITSLDVSGMFATEESLRKFCQSVAQSENPFETLIFDNCLFSPTSSSPSSSPSPSPSSSPIRGGVRRGASSPALLGPSRGLSKVIREMCDDCPSLRALSFQGTFQGRFSPHLAWLCEELQTQSSLLEIDLSNNGGGDAFAYALGGLLRKNKALAGVWGDGNGVSMGGFRIIRASLFDNASLQLMDFQWDDCMADGLPSEQLSSTLMDIHTKTISNKQLQEYPYESILLHARHMEEMEDPPNDPPPLSSLPPRLVSSSFKKEMKKWDTEKVQKRL